MDIYIYIYLSKLNASLKRIKRSGYMCNITGNNKT